MSISPPFFSPSAKFKPANCSQFFALQVPAVLKCLHLTATFELQLVVHKLTFLSAGKVQRMVS
jgi:hypothetical protein